MNVLLHELESKLQFSADAYPVDMVRHARKVYARLGFKGSLWVTETGYPSDPAFQFDPRFVGHDAAFRC